ncbi:double-strand break repair helicase AddA [Neotabrizicola sp. sgz301269]|uniref:double-strand break repair helicase AddA n=1 Tax=Neotabrizicola sp. sgz301269 TaxID=3276282 RepID=UPI0037701B71
MTSLATEHQNAAANPDSNVWLVANAGSGKTKVLTDRVARLLLRGVDPQNILCLTYTKAAAAEMQNRLFQRLGQWAMAPEAVLLRNLADLGEGAALPPERLARARQLFARAIEAPGGIRIQTIHSFCASLLRRFPLEAGVSPAFTEIDDRSAALLRAEIFDQMAEGPEAGLLNAILPDAGEETERLIDQIIANRAALAQMPSDAVLRDTFGLAPGFDETALLAGVFLGGEAALLNAILPVLRAGKSTDAKAAEKLSGLGRDLASLAVLEDVLLTGSGAKEPFSAKIGTFPTKDIRAALAAQMPQLEALMQRVEAARPLRLGLAALRASERLHRFASAYLARYETAKATRGWLDFDDLIVRATALLTDPGIAPWVLYRLDGAIDHVLVDEAQDTSPAQWRIIAALTAEFTAGEGARRVARSLFVVGDKKQSIYSFQGADVAGFDTVKGDFKARFEGADQALVERPLVYSFRSSEAVLQLVDRAFPGPMTAALGGLFEHKPFHETMPGRVDLWPPVPKAEKPEPKDWFDPVDLPSDEDAPVVLARRIAHKIAGMLERGEQIFDHQKKAFRPLRAGDVLVLVQRRKELFHEIIRACKKRGLPIAGADRLKLAEELAVRDLLALLAFVNTPEDDLALATALRSPLFGWSEQQLFTLAQGRKGFLWERLRDTEDETTLAVLHDLRDRAEFLRPYELLDRILTRHGGRARLLGRLGEEAADAIDELVSQALTYERAEVPSLTGFLVWMQAGDVEAKRQAESEGAMIRVMTVHGSKGLEAPLVILPETQDRDLKEQDRLIPLQGGVVAWNGRAEENPAGLAAEKAARKAAREAENLRLLYVALTRARCWLIVAGAGECGPTSWHGIVAAALAGLPTAPLQAGVLRYQFGPWPEPETAPAETKSAQPAPPDWAAQAPHPPPTPRRVFSPSRLGGDKLVARAEPVEITEIAPEEDRLERGSLLHLLLEHLPDSPPQDWPALAETLGAGPQVLAEARAILSDPALAWIFAPGTLAEVPLSTPWNRDVLIGAADRLIVTPDVVTVVDFKSNVSLPAGPDAIPEAYLRQLGAYALALEGIYPGRRIDTAILWTRGPQLMAVSAEIVRAALSRATSP